MGDDDEVDAIGETRSDQAVEDESVRAAKEARGKRKPVKPRGSHQRAKRSGRGRPRAPVQIEIDLRAYISRVQAARLLGCTVTQMRRDEDIWFAGTSIRRKGVTYYPRQQFEELRQSKIDGSFECYELFAQGYGPHEVTMRLRHRKPAVVRMSYQDYLANVALEASRTVLELDPDMNSEDWKRAHGFPVDRPLHQAWIRTALERVAMIASLREACDLAVQRFEQSRRRRGKGGGSDEGER
jgi:hypothetical protein